MRLTFPRVHFCEINDLSWFPHYLRERVQSCLTLCCTFRAPVLQKDSPAQLVASILYQTLSDSLVDYTYVDFCAGAGGPTPYIAKHLNTQLSHVRALQHMAYLNAGRPTLHGASNEAAVKFILTDLHPHITNWTDLSKRSDNLSFVSESVDAGNAPTYLNGKNGKKIFRLYNLAFHHFDDVMGKAILRNTIETAHGFGFVTPLPSFLLLIVHSIFELQERTISSFITVFCMGILMFLITPFYFWRSPGHVFFTYIIPVIPFVLVFDGIVSSLRTRSADEVRDLMKACGASCDGWSIKSGHERHTWPTGYITWSLSARNSA